MNPRTLNAVIDIGNSRVKIALFNQDTLVEKHSLSSIQELFEFLGGHRFEHALVSSVRTDPADIIPAIQVSGEKWQLTSSTKLPLGIAYDTPATLGVDRIAAACGAASLFPRTNSVVIDMGTCITYDFVSASGNFEGGAIAPGLRMRFAAMHQFTARLPQVEPVAAPPLTGKSTIQSMQSGVMNGVLEEINGFVSRYQSQYGQVTTVACGGDLAFFENSLKPSIFVAPDLVLIGLNKILLHQIDD